MTIINHECYVSLEVAKLLKEVGFDWECWGNYSPKGTFQQIVFEWKPVVENWNNTPNAKNCTSAPTIEIAQRWLREVKGIFVCVIPEIKDYHVTWNFYICNEQGLFYENEDCFLTYEEALSAGIFKCLTLLLKQLPKEASTNV